MVYVHRGDGTTTGQNAGISLNDTGQKLIGSGSNLTLSDLDVFTANGRALNASSTLLAADPAGAPVITNGAGRGVTIGADNVSVAGLTVDGATSHGIYAINSSGLAWDSVNINNNSTTGNAESGIRIQVNSAGSAINNVTVNNITTTNNTNSGLFVYLVNSGQLSNITTSGINASGNAQHGLLVFADNNSQIYNMEMDNIATTGNTLHGLRIASDGAGSFINNATVNNITTTGNTQNGLQISAASGAKIGGLTMNNITATGNVQYGARMESNGVGSVVKNVVLDAFYTTGNTQSGLLAFTQNSGLIEDMTIQNINATGNALNGLRILANSNGQIDNVKMNTVITTGNTQHGVHIDDDTTGTFNVDMGGAFGSVGGSSIFGNTGTDLRVDLDGGELKAENNWWGDAAGLQPARVTLGSGSTVDSTPFLTTAP
jgi:hypothetical protein